MSDIEDKSIDGESTTDVTVNNTGSTTNTIDNNATGGVFLYNGNLKSKENPRENKFSYEKEPNIYDKPMQYTEEGIDQNGHKGLKWYQQEAKKKFIERKQRGQHIRITQELQELIESECIEWIVDGMNKRKVIHSLKHEWQLSRVWADKVYNSSLEQLKELTDSNLKLQRTLAIRRFEKLYNMAMLQHDIRAAKDIQVELGKLFGLNEPNKLDLTMKTKPLEEYTNEEIEMMLKDERHLLDNSTGSNNNQTNVYGQPL